MAPTADQIAYKAYFTLSPPRGRPYRIISAGPKYVKNNQHGI